MISSIILLFNFKQIAGPEVLSALKMVICVTIAVPTYKVGHSRFRILFHDDVIVSKVKLHSCGRFRVVTYVYGLLKQ